LLSPLPDWLKPGRAHLLLDSNIIIDGSMAIATNQPGDRLDSIHSEIREDLGKPRPRLRGCHCCEIRLDSRP
jgi:hypothetical protein